jgi:hypothetical protein
LFRATTGGGGGAAAGFEGETGAGEFDGDVDVAVCDDDRGGATGAGSGVETTGGGVCVGGGVVATGAAGFGVVAAGAAGRLATRTAGASLDGSGGARNVMSSDNPTKPIATAAPPYTSSILIERPRLRGRGCRAYPSVASTESECDSP